MVPSRGEVGANRKKGDMDKDHDQVLKQLLEDFEDLRKRVEAIEAIVGETEDAEAEAEVADQEAS